MLLVIILIVATATVTWITIGISRATTAFRNATGWYPINYHEGHKWHEIGRRRYRCWWKGPFNW